MFSRVNQLIGSLPKPLHSHRFILVSQTKPLYSKTSICWNVMLCYDVTIDNPNESMTNPNESGVEQHFYCCKFISDYDIENIFI